MDRERRHHADGISSAAFHPGIVATSFGASVGPFITTLYGSRLAKPVFTAPQQGADQLVRLAEGTPGRDWESGRYWVRRRVGRTSPLADETLASRLWDVSAAMVGLA